MGESVMARLQELTLVFHRERVRFDESNVAVVECVRDANGAAAGSSRPDVDVKVECDRGELQPRLSYRFFGHWIEHPKYGQQFHAQTFVRCQPHSRAGIIRYLMRAPHVGQATAKLLWDKFGGDAVKLARESPDVASAAVGGKFTPGRAKEVAAFLENEKATEDATIDLIGLLSGRGFPRNTGKEAVAEWGNRAAALIERNPYLLMRFRGCGFLRCDKLYLDCGGNPAKLKRQALCAWYSIARDTDGHTWHTPGLVERGMAEMISGGDVRPVRAVQLALRGKLLSARRDDSDQLWLADAAKAHSEATIAERVAVWQNDSASAWPSVVDLDVSEHQREQLAIATSSHLGALVGGPGTGKTYSAARLIAAIKSQHGRSSIAVAAPTGKAAVRISEALDSYGVQLRAKTIHSLLKVESHSAGGGWSFQHDENNPLPFRFIVVDESSMVDCGLAASLVRACAPGTHLLLVGDPGQLPPVGHGAPLRDLIAAGVATGELTEIRRNSGRIVEACHEIRGGSSFGVCAAMNPEVGENLSVTFAGNPHTAIDRIVSAIVAIGWRGIACPVWGCQVVVAVNKRSELSREKINRRLQGELNPNGGRATGNPFRTGDKIVCLRNGFYPVVPESPTEFNKEQVDGKVFVANGEQGDVKHVEPRLTIVQLGSPPRLVKVPRGNQSGSNGEDGEESSDTGCQWDLAYAISCHKSQGSEWPIVFVVLDEYPGARMVCSREWLYTAISRAKQACFLVGKLPTAYGMIQREAIKKRKTFLRELIQ